MIKKSNKKTKKILFNESWKTFIKIYVCFIHLVNKIFR